VPGLDELCGGGLLERSTTLVSGSPGIGKSTLALQFLVGGVKRNEPGLYIALEEGPAQLRQTAESLGMSLEQATAKGLVELAYLPRDRARAGQFLTILDDKIRAHKTRRLVLDGLNQIVQAGVTPDDLRQLLHALVVRVKALGVTSMVTLEASTMYSTDLITERGYSPIADNIFLLRYAQALGERRPTLAVVKTRGSAHDEGTYYFGIAKGGIRIAERIDRAAAPAKRPGPGSKRVKP
jgi:circadian clock protein KaiC